MLRGLGRKGYNSTIEQSTGSDRSLSALKLSSASSPPIWSRGDDKAGWLANEHSRNGRLTGSEALNSKGFSSVSVQNVNAIARLPHVDGTSDGQRVSAKSILSAAGKAASPQLPPGPTPSAEGFYGPYRRETRGITVTSDDIFHTRGSKEEEM